MPVAGVIFTAIHSVCIRAPFAAARHLLINLHDIKYLKVASF